MANHKVGYVRISTADPGRAQQLADLSLDRLFEDRTSTAGADRPALRQCLAQIGRGDELVVDSFDRLARSQTDLQRLVNEITGRGATVSFIKEALRFEPHAQARNAQVMFEMLAAFANFERNLVRERQRAGIELAKQRGAYKGRKPSVTDATIQEIRRRFTAGEPRAAIARSLNISRMTVYRYASAAGAVVDTRLEASRHVELD